MRTSHQDVRQKGLGKPGEPDYPSFFSPRNTSMLGDITGSLAPVQRAKVIVPDTEQTQLIRRYFRIPSGLLRVGERCGNIFIYGGAVMDDRKFKTVEVEKAMAGVTAIWYLPRNRVLYFYNGMSKKSNYEKMMRRERKRECFGAVFG